MHDKRSARKNRQLRDRNRRRAKTGVATGRLTNGRLLRCEPLESRVLLDAGGLFSGDGLPFPLPEPIDPLPPLQPGNISGRVWQDLDGNRAQNGNEPGMGGVTVYSDFNFNGVLDAHEPHAITDVDDPSTDFDEGGRYTLADLQPGYHNVRQVGPNGFEQTYPSLPDGYLPPPWGDASVHVTFAEQGHSIEDVDFGNKQIEPSSVRGVKWEDANGNAVRDADERGLPGVIIFSDRNLNGLLDPDEPQTVSSEDHPDTDFDEAGQYALENLDPGWHWIKEVVPEGYRQTFPNSDFFPPPGFAEGVDVAIAPGPIGGQPHDVFLLPGQSIDNIDFGNQQIVAGSISGVKWADLDGDGVRSADEAGLAGVTIYADLNFNAQFDADEPHAITAADLPETDFDEGGRYAFAVDPGFYLVREVVPDGYRQTFPNAPFPTPVPWLPAIDVGILPPQDGAHFVVVESGQSVESIDFGNRPILPSSIRGVKWEDANGNAEFDPWESGLAGVTIYADLNDNGLFDADEPHAITTADLPETDFDEGGRYAIEGLSAGDYVIRESVPDGFRQTFPVIDLPRPLPAETSFDQDGLTVDEFATVDPDRLDLELAAGDVIVTEVAVTIHPSIFVPIEIDVMASLIGPNVIGDPTVINLSGPQVNGGTGDTSVFQIMVISDGNPFVGELQFVDIAGGSLITSIPLSINAESGSDGAHRVSLGQGETIEGLDFGNQQLVQPQTGWVSGRKWVDLDGNAERGASEPGLAGVTIYADHNLNGRLDVGEPRTTTMRDNPATDFDEQGWYRLETATGLQAIREVAVIGYVQTFPTSDAASPLERGAHFVNVRPNGHIEGLDFGNQPIDVFTAAVRGVKWEDVNANGRRDANEIGLGGVTIYSDLNFDGVFDANEPHAVTRYDIPETDFDESGLYSIGDLAPGVHVVREVLPAGYVQIFPSPLLAIPNSDAHTVFLAPGEAVDSLDFGNLRTDDPHPLPGDFNGDGVVDGRDLDTWAQGYGSGDSLPTVTGVPSADRMDGGGFLLWQRNYGRVLPVPAAVTSDVATASAAVASAVVPQAVAQITGVSSAEMASVGVARDAEGALPLASLAGLSLRSPLGTSFSAGRSYLDAIEAAFAGDSGAVNLQPRRDLAELRLRTAGQPGNSTLAIEARGGVAGRSESGGLLAAIDAALASEFGERHAADF